MKFLHSIVALLFITVSFGQSIIREDNETIESFVNRLKPLSVVLAHPIIETNTWDSSSKAIIALYGYGDTSEVISGFNKIVGHLYFPIGMNKYRDYNFGPIEEDGGYPEVLSVFFANADKDPQKELIVLCKYEQRHYDYSGTFYESFIFDNPDQQSSLPLFEKLSERFYGCECGWRTGKVEIAKFKTAKAVKAGFKQLGF
jgi:hypothetical protein